MSLENFVLNQLQDLVLSGKTRNEKWRRAQLKSLSNLLENHQQEILKALSQDLGKPATEAFFEIIAVKQEIKLAQKNFCLLYTSPSPRDATLSRMPSSA